MIGFTRLSEEPEVVAFIMSILVAVGITAGIVAYMRRRPVGTPVTWGEANVGALVVFFLMFWVYGVVPHQWLTWADNELSWRADKFFHGPGGILKPQTEGGWNPITLNYVHIRDVIAVAIYGIFLGANIALWSMWQNRGAASEEPEPQRSSFGRPLVKEGASA